MSLVQIQEKDGQVFTLELSLDAETICAMLSPWSRGATGLDSEWLAVAENAKRTQAGARSPFLSAVAARFRAHPKCRLQTDCAGLAFGGQTLVSGVQAILTSLEGFVCVRVGLPSSGRVPLAFWALDACEFPTRDPDMVRICPGTKIEWLFAAIDDILACGLPAPDSEE
jgi:hypothetical protein